MPRAMKVDIMRMDLLLVNFVFLYIPTYAATLVDGDEEIPSEPYFVIAGGGTAGCVLIDCLCSDLPIHKPVLLKRGPPRTDEVEIIVNALRNAYAMYAYLLQPINVDLFNYFSTESNPSLSDPNTGTPGRMISLIEDVYIGRTSNVTF